MILKYICRHFYNSRNCLETGKNASCRYIIMASRWDCKSIWFPYLYRGKQHCLYINEFFLKKKFVDLTVLWLKKKKVWSPT